MGDEQRYKVWVDHFQTKLTLRISAYMVIFLVVLFNFVLAWRLWVEGPGNLTDQMWRLFLDYLPVGICLLVLIPVMVWDAVRFTHRLIGPLARFRRIFQDVAQGQPVRPIKLREGDYLTDFRDDINLMLEALQRRGSAVLKPKDPGQDEPARTSA
jgi:hypothetical protein